MQGYSSNERAHASYFFPRVAPCRASDQLIVGCADAPPPAPRIGISHDSQPMRRYFFPTRCFNLIAAMLALCLRLI